MTSKIKNRRFKIMTFLTTLLLCLIPFTFSCLEEVPSWMPKKEEEMKLREELRIPDVRFKHNLKGAGALNILVGKAYWENVQEGATTPYQKSEDGDIAIVVTKPDSKMVHKIIVSSATVGGGPLKKGRKYTVEMRKNVKGQIEYRTHEDTAVEAAIFD